ncbi:MAG: MFS transporter [Lysobacterales bacterium]
MAYRGFYGWYVLGGLFAVYAISNGIAQFTLPLLYPSLMEEFGWNQAEITRPAAIKFLFASVYNLAVGFLLDRYPPRPIMAAGAVIMVTGLVSMMFMSTLWHFTGAYLLLAFGISMCGLVPCMVTVSRWFVKFRGRAVGILLMASSAGGAILPLIIRDQLVNDAWRSALLTLSIIGLIGMLLPVLWPLRARPSDIGEKPDGIDAELDDVSGHTQLGIFGGTSIANAVRMPVFYLLLFATGILWFCITGVLQHQSLYLGRDNGLDGGSLALLFSVFFWFSIVGKVVFGWLSDHFLKVNIMLLAVVNLALGLLILRFVQFADTNVVYLYAAVYGIGFSGTFTMIQLMVADLFSGPTYGRILGIFVAVDTIAAGIGIAVIGEIRVAAGSYAPAINLMIAMVGVAFGCVYAVKQISRRRMARLAEQPAA